MDAEGHILEQVLRAFSSRNASCHRMAGLRTAIGDDAALITVRTGKELVASCDMFLEGVHFIPNLHPADSVGFKALMRAASDLAAMGATPRSFLLALALPRQRRGRWLTECMQGMARAARRLGMALAGGDLSRSSSIQISITVLGEIRSGRAVLRCGARPGDQIYVSGILGLAELGWSILQRNPRLARLPHKRLSKPLLAHLYPDLESQTHLGRWLADRRLPSAMMDLSDGLSSDLARLCAASGVGAVVREDCLPTPGTSEDIVSAPGSSPSELALHGGDDYQLLFTVPRHRCNNVPRCLFGMPITHIGEISRGAGVKIQKAGGRRSSLPVKGWDSFSR